MESKEIMSSRVTVDGLEYKFRLNHISNTEGVKYHIEVYQGDTGYIVESHDTYYRAVESFRKMIREERDGFNRGIIRMFFKEMEERA